MNDVDAIFNAAGVAATVVFFLVPIVILFFKMVDDTLKPEEFFWLCLPFLLSGIGVLWTRKTPLQFLFWFTGIGFWVGLPIYLLREERQAKARMLEEDFAKCHRLIASDPHNAAGYAELGRLYSQQQQWAEAVESYSRAVELQPRNKKYRWRLGKARHAEEHAKQEPTGGKVEPEGQREEDPGEKPAEELPPTGEAETLIQKALPTLQVSEQECPRCPGTLLHSVIWQEVPLHGCGRCGGFWFQKAPLAHLLGNRQGTFSDLQALFGRQWSAVRRDREHLICPQCQAPLRRVTMHQVPSLALHGCSSCEGIWLEYGQLGQLEEGLQATLGP